MDLNEKVKAECYRNQFEILWRLDLQALKIATRAVSVRLLDMMKLGVMYAPTPTYLSDYRHRLVGIEINGSWDVQF